MSKKLTAIIALGAALLLPAAGVQAKELQYTSHLPPVLPVSVGVQKVFEAVAAATDNDVTVKYFWAGQLYKPADAFAAISDGVADAGFTLPSENQAQMPVNLLFSDLFFLGGDPYVMTAAVNETVLLDCPECKDEYTKSNTMFLGTSATTSQIMACGKEIASMDDLKGVKIAGAPTITRWAEAIGGTQITLPPPARMEAMQKHLADCTIIPMEWLKAFSIAEATKTVITVPHGSQFSISPMTFNKETWEGLSDKARMAFLKSYTVALKSITDAYIKREGAARADGEGKGITFKTLDGAYQAAFDGFLDSYVPGVIEAAKARGVANADKIVATLREKMDKWSELLAEKGTDNYDQLLWDEIYAKASM